MVQNINKILEFRIHKTGDHTDFGQERYEIVAWKYLKN